MGDFFDSPYLPAERYMFLYAKPDPAYKDMEECTRVPMIVQAMRVSDYLMVSFCDKQLSPPKELKVDSVKPGDQFFHGNERFTKLQTPGRTQIRATDTLAYDVRYGLRLFSTQTRVES